MPELVKTEASRANVRWQEFHNLDEVIGRSDVLYVTRVQKERFDNLAEYEAVKDMFIINNDVLARAKESAIVMHPLPRTNEIDAEVDYDVRRAAYFRQMRYGLFVSGLGCTLREEIPMLTVGCRYGWRSSLLSSARSTQHLVVSRTVCLVLLLVAPTLSCPVHLNPILASPYPNRPLRSVLPLLSISPSASSHPNHRGMKMHRVLKN